MTLAILFLSALAGITAIIKVNGFTDNNRGSQRLGALKLNSMDFKKIQLAKKSTLQVVYSNADSDTVTVAGANIVHKDLKEAFKNLVPHLAMLTEQKEAGNLTLEELEQQRSWAEKSIYTRLSVDSLSINGREIQISGTRILDRGDVICVDSPKIDLESDEKYGFLSELSLAIDNLKYEAEQYITERKWGLKEATIDFNTAGDPFKDGKQADDVPSVSVELPSKPKGSSRKHAKSKVTA